MTTDVFPLPAASPAVADTSPIRASASAANAGTTLQRLEAELLAMPPVAALQLRLDAYDGACLRLRAPLAPNLNDKGCAFGGSLVSLMTLAGWGLVMMKLMDAGLEADVYVADSDLRYRAPLYADLLAEATLADGESWDVFFATLRSRGKARLEIVATVPLPEGGVATESRSRYVAKRRMQTE
jgi:thioesterase domain-containing protein